MANESLHSSGLIERLEQQRMDAPPIDAPGSVCRFLRKHVLTDLTDLLYSLLIPRRGSLCSVIECSLSFSSR